jgi:hypothetical protein
MVERTTRSLASKFLFLAGATVLFAFTAVGCAAGVEGGEADLEQAPTLESQSVPDECAPGQYGFFTCTNPIETFDYSAPGCGFGKRLTMQALCEDFCNVPCIDSGWGG